MHGILRIVRNRLHGCLRAAACLGSWSKRKRERQETSAQLPTTTICTTWAGGGLSCGFLLDFASVVRIIKQYTNTTTIVKYVITHHLYLLTISYHTIIVQFFVYIVPFFVYFGFFLGSSIYVYLSICTSICRCWNHYALRALIVGGLQRAAVQRDRSVRRKKRHVRKPQRWQLHFAYWCWQSKSNVLELLRIGWVRQLLKNIFTQKSLCSKISLLKYLYSNLLLKSILKSILYRHQTQSILRSVLY